MYLEALVAFLCVTESECPQATKALYASRPAYQQMAKRSNKEIKKHINEHIIVGVPIIYHAISKRAYQIKISKYLSCGQPGERGMLCVYGIDF